MIFSRGFKLILGCPGKPKRRRNAPRSIQKGYLSQSGFPASFRDDFRTVFGARDPHESMRIVCFRALCTFQQKLEKRSEKWTEKTSKTMRNRDGGGPASDFEARVKTAREIPRFSLRFGVPGGGQRKRKSERKPSMKKVRFSKRDWAQSGAIRGAAGRGGRVKTLRVLQGSVRTLHQLWIGAWTLQELCRVCSSI